MGQRAGPQLLIIKPRLTLMNAGNPSDKLVSKHSGSKGQYPHQLSPQRKSGLQTSELLATVLIAEKNRRA